MAAVGIAYYTANPFEFGPNGVPLAGGQLFTYESGTVTPLSVFADPGLTTPLPNPVVADANGRFGSVWLSPSQPYKIQLFTAATPDNPTGSQIWSVDPFGPAAGGTASNSVGIIGEVRQFAGLAAAIPSQWFLCAGQAVSRTTYVDLFTVIGTAWGSGDGTTTFNIPDLRGRVIAGIDNMNGTPANRMTSGVSGISGVTLGASGGSQAVQTHDHTLTDPTHNHTLTDPTHAHNEQGSTVLGGTVGPAANAHGTVASFAGVNTAAASTGITIAAASTGITIANYGAGNAQNVQPTAMMNSIIYAGA